MTQAIFAAALLDPDAAMPSGLVGPDGVPAPKRFSVYRNNVTASLTRALEAGFPTVRKLVGEAFFAAMAVDFLRTHPPVLPQVVLYGAALPEFLATFPPVAHLGYLPDVARLDLALRESYHAADSNALAEDDFERLLGRDITVLRIQLAPSLRLIRSAWPLQSIWAMNHADGPVPQPGAEDVLVLRPDFDPAPHRLPPGGAAFLAGLLDGITLGDSVDLAGEGFDLTATIRLLITGRAITGVTEW